MKTHLLVTNDFPPKIGGIQSYLWELWSRLDPSTFTVLTAASDPDAQAFDAEQRTRGITIDRVSGRHVFLPTPRVLSAVRHHIERRAPDLVMFDPIFPLGGLAERISIPSVQIVHGAEVSIPGRLPGTRAALAKTLRSSAGVIAAGPFPEKAARQALSGLFPPVLEIPPGVDTTRFVPHSDARRHADRTRLGIKTDVPLIVSVSRLVPRKGMDTLIRAAAEVQRTHGDVEVAIGGTGRDDRRLRRLAAKERVPIRFLGHLDDHDLVDLVAAADVFSMSCRTRWAGLEVEGFGIVFLEAAAAGVAQVAGRSGGSADAVIDGETGLVVDQPKNPRHLAHALGSLLDDPERRRAMGRAGRARAMASYDYDVLAHRLGSALADGWPVSGEQLTA